MLLSLVIIMIFMFILITFNQNFFSYLITIEFMVITILYSFVYFNNLNMWIYLIYLVMSVCEAIAGLSLMVSLGFTLGHQKIEMVNLLC